MVFVLFGPPGSGKGTQARILVQSKKIPQLATGDMLRQAIQEGNSLGKVAQKYMDRGQLVPDHLLIDLIQERIQEEDCRKGFLLDGFPRTKPQAEALDKMLKKMAMELKVLSLQVDKKELLFRLTGRVTCQKCGASFHEQGKSPKSPGFCDFCGLKSLEKRLDDQKEVMEERLETFFRETAPLQDYYRQRNLLQEIPAQGMPEEVARRVQEALGEEDKKNL